MFVNKPVVLTITNRHH